MPDTTFDIHVWNASDADRPVEFEVTDRTSGVMLFRFQMSKADLVAALGGRHLSKIAGWTAPPERLAHAGKVMQLTTRPLGRDILDGVRLEDRKAAIRAAAEADLAARDELDMWHEVQPDDTNRGPHYTVRRYVTEEEARQPLPKGVRNSARIDA